MRFISKLAMAVAAIFFAGSVSAHHRCDKSDDLGKKVYQVCKSWRVDQGEPMPTDQMQHYINVLCQFSEDRHSNCTEENIEVNEGLCVNAPARANAKNELGYWN